MTCSEIREYLFAFLDSELDAPLSMEVQRHLERCPPCARQAEIEQAIRRQLATRLAGDGSERDFDPRVLEHWLVHGPARGPQLRRRWGRLLVGAAVALAGVTGVEVWLMHRSAARQAQRASFAEVLIDDFDHFLREGRPVQIASADRRAVADWLQAHTGLGVSLPAMHSGHCKLIGARKCVLAGRSAAFTLYEMNGTPASLIVLADGAPDLEQMRSTEHDGRVHWVDHCQGHTVVACRLNDLVYAAVSTLSEDELLHLMPAAEQE